MHLCNNQQPSRTRGSHPALSLLLTLVFACWTFVAPAVQAQTTEGLQRLVTIDADDAFLPSVLSILAAESGYNIVTGPQVNQEERISIHLRDTPIEQAMNLVVRAAGLSYEIVGKSFLVAPAKNLKEQVGLTSYVVNLKYTDAATGAGMLKHLSDEITIDATGNKLLIVTSPKVLADVQRVVDEVDVPPLQILLECRMIEVAVDNQEALGMDWNRVSSLQSVIMESPVDAYGNRVTAEGATDLS
ncbi:secretin and TonB N-terminal domain-containing protein, partial [bacterium]|nr:secretin and TonB N-terminal domain-containing protein [bacterium]